MCDVTGYLDSLTSREEKEEEEDEMTCGITMDKINIKVTVEKVEHLSQ